MQTIKVMLVICKQHTVLAISKHHARWTKENLKNIFHLNTGQGKGRVENRIYQKCENIQT